MKLVQELDANSTIKSSIICTKVSENTFLYSKLQSVKFKFQCAYCCIVLIMSIIKKGGNLHEGINKE
jgi:hypothetical protein